MQCFTLELGENDEGRRREKERGLKKLLDEHQRLSKVNGVQKDLRRGKLNLDQIVVSFFGKPIHTFLLFNSLN